MRKQVWKTVFLLVPLCSMPGCMVPHYHEPAGFSSTFHRELYEDEHLEIVGKEPYQSPSLTERLKGKLHSLLP